MYVTVAMNGYYCLAVSIEIFEITTGSECLWLFYVC